MSLESAGKDTGKEAGKDAASSEKSEIPSINLPKGGGAIRGIGEKFAANPVTGTGSMSVPIATSPGRSGFGPQLSISYDSGSGNGPFGVGWNLSLPAITRKTDKGLPLYYGEHNAEESHVFILSGAEDLVPVFKKNPDGSWARDQRGDLIYDEESRDGYQVKSYRPRIEGLFARIERWTRESDGDTHWRSISKDNILTVYGSTLESRIADPANPAHVFSWLICQSCDDKGNAIVYEYVAENGDNVDLSRINERNRVRSANRYLKYIRYGNRQPLLIDPTQTSFRQPHVPAPDFSKAGWMFEVVFDYGEGHYQEMPPDADGRIFATTTLKPPVGGTWPVRPDAFSTYRSCFEVRSYRLCRRVLMFHHFPDELAVDDYLVRSTELTYLEKPNGTFITQVLQSGFKRIALPAPRYLKRSLPPLDFEYTVSPLDDLTFDQLPLQEIDEESLQNLPSGIDGGNYRWVDLDGEGISGVLSEQADAWFYKPNLGYGQFGPVECVSSRPSLAMLNNGRQQLIDLAGDGNLDLVEFGTPTPGFFTRSDDAGWDRFSTFRSLPNIDWRDPNLRFVDLTGDGHADILITEDQAYSTWYESLAEEGFGSSNRVALPFDEEEGPRLLFGDGTQSVYLADMSGDGLSDLVRIRQSEVSYWPNIGYGRFGAKVTMNDIPWFDDAESFDERRVHLTDTDGSGPTDIVYLGRDGIRVYLNQHGNSLSEARLLNRAPRTDNLTSVSVVDFLGRGTACLLWSSPLPGDSRRPLRYLDLMGGVKPHLLKKVSNNLGAETRVEYESSTRFYLADKAAGTPWVTRLPFPVHVVTRVESNDLLSGNRFVTSYTYHHGYFDGPEREFRGFGRVDQLDTEEFGVLTSSGATATNHATAFYVPPTLTKTWFHTGAFLAGERISRHLEEEYYREGDPDQPGSELSQEQREAMLLDDTVLPPDLAIREIREAIRSLKGGILRQEIYALDDKEESDRPYSVSERNYTIKPMQPRGANLHSVFFTHARESIDFHYERKLFPVLNGEIADAATAAQNPQVKWLADPRVTHSVTLDVDEYGNVRQSVSIGYGRRFDDLDPVLTDADRTKQKQLLVTMTNASFTNAVIADDAYRTPLPAEVVTYELVKLGPAVQQPGITNLFRFSELVSLVARAVDGAHDLTYEDVNAVGALGAGPYRRPIEQVRTRYRSRDLAQLLALQLLEVPAVPGESYKLAFTPGLLNTVYQRPHAGQPSENLLPNPGAVLPVDATHESDRGGYLDLDGDGRWWIPSGRVFMHPDENATAPVEMAEAIAHFFLPRRFRNPFGHSTFVDYANDLLPVRTRDALGNTAEAVHDFRVLQPKQLTDPNGNRSFAAFDTFGMTVATAVSGKSSETLGDSLDDFGDFDADPALAQLQGFIASPRNQAPALLKSATARFVYDLDRFNRCGEPPFAATLARETHVSDPMPPQGLRIQVSFAYSDGFGRELQSKIQAEPGDAPTRSAYVTLPNGDISPGPLTLDSNGKPVLGNANPRWVGKGRTVYNNKGKPVKQYEPFFSSTHLYEAEPEMTDTGVTPILFYDPVVRVVATVHPNHTWEKVVFDPWRQETWDVSDTVLVADPKNDPDVGDFFRRLPDADYLPTWYAQRQGGALGPDEQAAAFKASIHAGTPSVAHADSLGRTFLAVAHNKFKYGNTPPADPPSEEFLATRVVLDIEGNQREVIDAKGRVVMRYDFDMLGTRIHQASMEAGERWMLRDVAGKPIRVWDSRDHQFRVEYDELRRPNNSFMREGAGTELVIGRTVYGESQANPEVKNQRTKAVQLFDQAGVVTSDEYDFKGNLLQSRRQIAKEYKATLDWAAGAELEQETFISATAYDALNRPTSVTAPDNSVYRPTFNEANFLEKVDVNLRGAQTATSFVANIDYDAKGQRTLIDYGNGVRTTYDYDPLTFRLVHLLTRRNATTFPGDCPQPPPANWPGCQVQNFSYTYDPAGNITHIRDDAQQTVFFRNRRVEPSADYIYDAIYRLIEATGREHLGQVGSAPIPHSYNDALRVGIDWSANDGNAMGMYLERYVYDLVGNFAQMIHRGTDPANPGWTRSYAYNEPSLLEPAKQSNRLSSTTIGNGNPVTEQYGYDAHGNMLRMPQLQVMQWDFRDQLQMSQRQAVNDADDDGLKHTGERTYYVYDVGGQRVRKVTERQAAAGQTPTRMKERIYLGGFEIYREFGNDGDTVKLERETLHIMDDKQRIALMETRTVDTAGTDSAPQQLIRYQFSNHLRSASLELDDTGQIISYEEYTPYGSTSYQAVRSQTEASKRYRYTGVERDEETGLEYHSARYYMPWLGRWCSVDPLLTNINKTEYKAPEKPDQRYAHFSSNSLKEVLCISWYSFCSNNPIVRIDPNGKIDYYSSEGEFVGNNGDSKDNSVLIVVNPQESEKIKDKYQGSWWRIALNWLFGWLFGRDVFLEKTPTAKTTIQGEILPLPSLNVRRKVVEALERSNKPTRYDPLKPTFIPDSAGGFHEEGGNWIKTATGQEIVLEAKPGSFSDPRIQGEDAHIDVFDSKVNSPAGGSFLGIYHIHPSGHIEESVNPKETPGTVNIHTTETTKIYQYDQEPSLVDLSVEADFEKNFHELNYGIVVGAREGEIYFYRSTNPGGKRYTAKIPLDVFKRGL